MNAIYKKLIKDTGIYGLGSVIKKVIGFLLVPLYTRALSPADYGVLNTLSVLVSILVLFGNFGMIGATNRYFFKADDNDKGNVLVTGISVSFVFSLLLVVLCYPFSDKISEVLLASSSYGYLVKISLVVVLLTVLVTYNDIVFRLYREAKKYLMVMIIRSIINPLSGILLVVVLGFGVLGAQLSGVITSVVVLTFSFFYFTRSKLKGHFSLQWAKTMLRYGAPFIGAGLAQWIYTSSDRFFLAHYSSLEDVGYYSIAFTFAQPIQLINIALSMSLGVIVISNYENEKDKDKPETKEFLVKFWSLYIVVTALLASFLCVFSIEMLSLLTTPEYIMGALGIPFHCFSMIFYQSSQTTGGGLSLKEKTKPYMWAMMFTAALNIGFNFVLIPRWGFVGALIATMMSQMLYFVTIHLLSQRSFKVNYQFFKVMSFLALVFSGCVFVPFSKLYSDFNISFWMKILFLVLVCLLPFVFKLISKHDIDSLILTMKKTKR